MSNWTKILPLQSTDTLVAAFMTTAGTFGVPANILSCYCFWRSLVPRRTNTSYFRTVYMIITVVDTLICLSQVPVIEALLAGRKGKFFGDIFGCKSWVIIWRSLSITSVFLVAQLSVSRLAVLAKPRLRISFRLVFLPVIVFVIAMITVCVTFLASFIQIDYFPNITVTCIFLGGNGGFNYTEAYMSPIPVPPAVVNADIISNILSSCSLGLPFIPILISFIASIFYLNRAKNSAVNIGQNTDIHRYATNTIIFVTLVCLLCNIPTIIFLTIRVYRMIGIGEQEGKTFYELSEIVNPTFFDKFYFRFLAEVGTVAVNSSLNPVIYLWRNRSFREAIFGKRKEETPSFVGMSLSPPGMTVMKPSTLSSNNALLEHTFPAIDECKIELNEVPGTIFENKMSEDEDGFEKSWGKSPASEDRGSVLDESQKDSDERFSRPSEWTDNDSQLTQRTYSPGMGWNDDTLRTNGIITPRTVASQEKIWDMFAACIEMTNQPAVRPVYFRTRKISKLDRKSRSLSM